MHLLKDPSFMASVLVSIVLLVAWRFVVVRRFGTTLPSLVVRVLYWYARWWMNLAVQYDRFLFSWREYRKANPINPVSEAATYPHLSQQQANDLAKAVSAQAINAELRNSGGTLNKPPHFSELCRTNKFRWPHGAVEESELAQS